ncbi:MAG: hypothetical protein L0Y66_10310 [Myxococcaceae bacterium]|nr:hypothetical protein [Myxococcaceae bacterium]
MNKRLDEKRLRALLSKTMREMVKAPAPDAGLTRLEGIQILSDQTVVFLSGNAAGLATMTRALQDAMRDVDVAKARRSDVFRLPRIRGRT